ncbi:SMI1/KNR4 family protein [Paenibacillus gorillae]|uniref:SMI1/KNR4 family protein n=1 Tax=Paenibacillus gorillae TaxID=1243662 RepID=UPI0005A9D785|nr:SMI1/KNR4 family protein [Paenibacillus gorillae]
MSNVIWENPSSMITESMIKEVEHTLGIKLPEDFVKIIIEHNGAGPVPAVFKVKNTSKIFGYLYSFHAGDSNFILEVYQAIKCMLPEKVIAIADTAGGDFICYDFSETDPALLYAEMDALISEDDLSDEELEQPELVDRLKREGIHPLAATISELINRLYASED